MQAHKGHTRARACPRKTLTLLYFLTVSDLIIAVAVGCEVLPAADEHLVGPADGDLQRRVTHPGGGGGPQRLTAALGRPPPLLLTKPMPLTRLRLLLGTLLLPPPEPSL